MYIFYGYSTNEDESIIQHHIDMARYTCATTILMKKGVSLGMVKEFLCYKNISSTMVYAKVTNSNNIGSMEKVKMLLSA